MEQTLQAFFEAVNANDVDRALACCAENVSCTYPDPGRNWQGRERGRIVMTAIFGQLARSRMQASFDIWEADAENRILVTRECWGHAHLKTTTTYTFTANNKIQSMES